MYAADTLVSAFSQASRLKSRTRAGSAILLLSLTLRLLLSPRSGVIPHCRHYLDQRKENAGAHSDGRDDPGLHFLLSGGILDRIFRRYGAKKERELAEGASCRDGVVRGDRRRLRLPKDADALHLFFALAGRRGLLSHDPSVRKSYPIL